ncbi:MAG: PilZ domain-containing protein [Gammaproteobacteria bacterium]|nr:PilZ domain-containing protein [Gammaproteobacteria bacterium]
MARHYSEKRNFIRMRTNSRITYRKLGSHETFEGQCLNLSAVGVLFTSTHNIQPGTMMEINITPEHALVEPLDATIKVVRTQHNSQGRFDIAGEIKALNQ